MKLLSLAVAVPFVALTALAGAAGPAATGDPSAATSALSATVEASEPLLKCDRRTDAPHYIIDGVFFRGGAEAEAEVARAERMLSDDSVHSLYITCWDPEARTLRRGIGEPVVHVTTKAFMVALNEDMSRVVAAQDAYHTQHRRFAGAITDLDADIVTPGLEVTIATSDEGWHATARGDLLIVSCSVFAGPIEPPSAALTAREPSCEPLPQFAY